jgi:hypothetical protein
VSILAAVDQRTGMRTEVNPALFMRGKYAESSVTPHSPSLGRFEHVAEVDPAAEHFIDAESRRHWRTPIARKT